MTANLKVRIEDSLVTALVGGMKMRIAGQPDEKMITALAGALDESGVTPAELVEAFEDPPAYKSPAASDLLELRDMEILKRSEPYKLSRHEFVEMQKKIDQMIRQYDGEEKRKQSGYKKLQEVILSYLAEHVEGALEIELRELFKGAATALGHDGDSVQSAIMALQHADKVLLIQEDFEWPKDSGWVSTVTRVRVAPDEWVKAVSNG